MGVKTNNGIEFTKKRWVLEQWYIRFDRRKKKKMGVKTNNGIKFTKKKMGLRATMPHWAGFAKIDLKRIFKLLFNTWSFYYVPHVIKRTFWCWDGIILLLGTIHGINLLISRLDKGKKFYCKNSYSEAICTLTFFLWILAIGTH